MADQLDADVVLRSWGKAVRRRASADESLPCVLGRVRTDGAAGAAQGARGQRVVEGLTGNALLGHRALAGAPEAIRDVVVAAYVVEGVTVGQRAQALGMSRASYHRALDCARAFVAGRLDRIELDSPR
jgi:DNA-directed RNA polymerase specialized sigma24 family protein